MRTLFLALALTLAFAAAASGASSTGRSKAARSGTDGEIAFIKDLLQVSRTAPTRRLGGLDQVTRPLWSGDSVRSHSGTLAAASRGADSVGTR
jgi:hypothetical protein